MLKYILSLIEKNPNENMLCLLCATYCPVFEVKAKINVSVTFWRHKSTDFYMKRFLFLIYSVARTRFDDSTKN